MQRGRKGEEGWLSLLAPVAVFSFSFSNLTVLPPLASPFLHSAPLPFPYLTSVPYPFPSASYPLSFLPRLFVLVLVFCVAVFLHHSFSLNSTGANCRNEVERAGHRYERDGGTEGNWKADEDFDSTTTLAPLLTSFTCYAYVQRDGENV
jgi:hypothetical protein